MILETQDALDRYSMKRSTFYGKIKVIRSVDAVLPRTGTGSTRNLFNSDELDILARDGRLGTSAKKAILNLDQTNQEKVLT